MAVIGPEEPLAAGLADGLLAVGVPVFGPAKNAARIETSKAFAKDVMAGAGAPTARAVVVHDLLSGFAALDTFTFPVAVKADGLAFGAGAWCSPRPAPKLRSC